MSPLYSEKWKKWQNIQFGSIFFLFRSCIELWTRRQLTRTFYRIGGPKRLRISRPPIPDYQSSRSYQPTSDEDDSGKSWQPLGRYRQDLYAPAFSWASGLVAQIPDRGCTLMTIQKLVATSDFSWKITHFCIILRLSWSKLFDFVCNQVFNDNYEKLWNSWLIW